MSDPKANALAMRQALGVERLAEHLYRSGYWADARSQSQAIVKVLRGAELDIGPISSMDAVYVIEGKTSLNATLLGSLIQRSERYRYRVVEHDDTHCVIDFYEIVDGKREKLGTSKFDLEDAKKADLLGKRMRMWEKFPRNMVFSRALSNGARWYTPDVFNGPVYTPDELGVEVDESGRAITVYEAPPPLAEPSVPTRERDAADQPRRAAVDPNRIITSADDRVWKRWEEIRSEAFKYAIVPADLKLGETTFKQLVDHGTMTAAQIEDKKAKLALDQAATAAWERNRALQAEAYALGIRLKDLPNTASTAEVAERNTELERLIAEAPSSAEAPF